LRKRIASGSVGAVIAQCPVSARMALDLRLAHRATWPVLLVCHFNHSEAREYRAKGELKSNRVFDAMMAFEDAVLREVDQVVYVSGWARDVVEHERGIQPRSSHVIWNGLPDLRASSPQSRRTIRESLGVAEDQVAIINVGSLEPRKNQLALLDLFARIAAQSPVARLLLVGDGASRPAIEKRIAELKLAEKVRLLGMRHDVPELLAASDIYLHYATAENCPVVLVEAARAGLPVAAIPAGGVPELQREIGGIDLSVSGDLDVSLQALRAVLHEPSARTSLGIRAREAFERRFTRDAMVRQYLSLIESPPITPEDA
jgi:glycosyltransferase involved in cell wall biosynthesis